MNEGSRRGIQKVHGDTHRKEKLNARLVRLCVDWGHVVMLNEKYDVTSSNRAESENKISLHDYSNPLQHPGRI